MASVCIIPARGGSKRVPRKNIRPFLGKPIIGYSISLALRSGLFNEVMVSTDDQEVGEVAEKLGAKIPFWRSEKNSGDMATTMDVLQEVVQCYEEMGMYFGKICCLYPTAPLVRDEDFRRGYDLLDTPECQVSFPVSPFSYPVWRGFRVNERYAAEMIWPQYAMTRSQDLEPVYQDAGQWYWMKPNVIQRGGSLFEKGAHAVVLDHMQVQDIDNECDWELAEVKYKLMHNEL